MIKNFLIRHRKCDVEEQIDMPGYDETLIWVDQTEMEKSLYMSKVGRTSRTVLQQLCCHPLIAETFNRSSFFKNYFLFFFAPFFYK